MSSQKRLKRPAPEKKAKIISFISGKGGVGKTAVAGSIADVLSHFGYSVLLMDLDVATHGLSYFFMDEIQQSGRSGVLEVLEEIAALSANDKPEKPSPSIVVKLKDGPDIVASTSRFETRPGPTELDEPQLVSWKGLARLIRAVAAVRPRYDYIIFDTQAGATPSTYAAVRCSDVVVTVMEPDPVCMWATRIAERRLSSAFARAAESFYLGNKLFFQEVEQYQAITQYLRGFAHLPPLPFDMEVRFAFLRRVLPTRWEGASAFVFGVARMLKDLLPETRTKVAAFEEEKRREIFGPTEEELRTLEEKIDTTREQIEYGARRSERRYMITAAMSAAFLIAPLVIATAAVLASGRTWTLDSDVIVTSLFVMISVIAVLTMLMPFSPIRDLFIRFVRGPFPEKEVLAKTLDELLDRRKTLKTLLKTRSEELMFPPEKK